VAKQKEAEGTQRHTRLGLENLASPEGSHRTRKRLGRGPGSGTGKTAGKGTKGIKARAGHHGPGGGKPHFEGGQMPMTRRVPKRGFHNPARVANQIVRLDAIDVNKSLTDVNTESLIEAGLIRKGKGRAKVLANGPIGRAVAVKGILVSGKARDAIVAAGGSVED
jgi:large subunit ribosomal protein L15